MPVHRFAVFEIQLLDIRDRYADDPVNSKIFQAGDNRFQNPRRDPVSAEFFQHHHIQQIRITDPVGKRPHHADQPPPVKRTDNAERIFQHLRNEFRGIAFPDPPRTAIQSLHIGGIVERRLFLQETHDDVS